VPGLALDVVLKVILRVVPLLKRLILIAVGDLDVHLELKWIWLATQNIHYQLHTISFIINVSIFTNEVIDYFIHDKM
jgi:hypothetical protein